MAGGPKTPILSGCRITGAYRLHNTVVKRCGHYVMLGNFVVSVLGQVHGMSMCFCNVSETALVRMNQFGFYAHSTIHCSVARRHFPAVQQPRDLIDAFFFLPAPLRNAAHAKEPTVRSQ